MTCPPKLLPAAALLVATFVMLTISWPGPALALEPVQTISPPPMEPGHPYCGTVSGRVTSENTSTGLAGAYVAIVNAADVSRAYYEGHADENGYYLFPAVNNTVTGGSPGLSYRVYASVAGAGEGISSQFGVGENATSTANVVIAGAGKTSSGFQVVHVPMPDEVRLSAQPETLLAGGNESTVTARLYLNGEPYQRAGVVITFCTDNDTMGHLPGDGKVISGSDGRAFINLTSGNVTGDLSVTGYTHIGVSRNLTGTCTVHILCPALDDQAAGWEGTARDVNGTVVSNTTGACGTTAPSAPPQTPPATEVSAMPEPTPSAITVGAHVLLAVLLAGVAGFAVYVLAFRKK